MSAVDQPPVEVPFGITIQTARELCDRPDPEGDDRLLGPVLVREQRTIIGGDTGSGKTTMSMAIVAAYVNATKFLSWTGAGGRALILDLEQGERTAKLRLREAGLEECDLVDYALIPDGLALDSSAEQRAELERLFAAGNYGVVLLDPHYKAHRGEANDEAQVKALMAHLDRWRADYGFALLLPTHARKPPAAGRGRLTIHDIASGSGAIVRGAENVFAVEVEKPGVTRLWTFKHRDGDDELPVGGDPWTLSFTRGDGYRRITTTTGARKAPADAIAIWIRGEGGRATPKEIRDHFDIGESTLLSRREELADHGIEYRGTGKKAEYVDPRVHPSIALPDPVPVPRGESRGHDFAGSNGPTMRESDPAPHDPTSQAATGSENALSREKALPRTPRSL